MPTGVIVIGVLLLITAPMNMISAIIFYGPNPAIIIFQSIQAILIIVVAICLLMGQNWARIAAIILSFLSVMMGVAAIALGQVSAIVNIIIVLTIAVYLVSNKNVIRAFSGKENDFEDEYYDYEDYYEEPEEYDVNGFAKVFPGEYDDEGFTEVISDDPEDENLDDTGPRKLVFRIKGEL